MNFSQLVDVPRNIDRLPPPAPGAYAQRLDNIAFNGEVDERFLCAMGMHVMTDPVTLNGRIYDKPYIEAWIARSSTDPFSRAQVSMSMSQPLPELKREIEHFVEQCELAAQARSKP